MVPGVFLVGECAAATMFAGGVAGPWPRVFIASERVRSLGARVPTAPAAAGEDFLSIPSGGAIFNLPATTSFLSHRRQRVFAPAHRSATPRRTDGRRSSPAWGLRRPHRRRFKRLPSHPRRRQRPNRRKVTRCRQRGLDAKVPRRLPRLTPTAFHRPGFRYPATLQHARARGRATGRQHRPRRRWRSRPRRDRHRIETHEQSAG